MNILLFNSAALTHIAVLVTIVANNGVLQVGVGGQSLSVGERQLCCLARAMLRGNRVLCMDLHAAQIQGFFDIPVDHLTATKVCCDYFATRPDMQGDDMVIVSPDVGNVKVANMYAGLLDAKLAIIDKRRESGTEVVSKRLIGDVEGKTVH